MSWMGEMTEVWRNNLQSWAVLFCPLCSFIYWSSRPKCNSNHQNTGCNATGETWFLYCTAVGLTAQLCLNKILPNVYTRSKVICATPGTYWHECSRCCKGRGSYWNILLILSFYALKVTYFNQSFTYVEPCFHTCFVKILPDLVQSYVYFITWFTDQCFSQLWAFIRITVYRWPWH